MSGAAPDPLDLLEQNIAENADALVIMVGIDFARTMLEVARAARAVTTKQQECLENLRSHGVVFTDIGNDPTNWQHVAFTIYTDLCEAESITSAALTLLDKGGAA